MYGGMSVGELLGRGNVGNTGENIRISLQDYKSLREAVRPTICATLVNTQTHTERQLLTDCTISSAS